MAHLGTEHANVPATADIVQLDEHFKLQPDCVVETCLPFLHLISLSQVSLFSNRSSFLNLTCRHLFPTTFTSDEKLACDQHNFLSESLRHVELIRS